MSVKLNTESMSNINNFNIKLKIDDKWKNIISPDVLKSATKNIKIASKKNLTNSEVSLA